MHALKPEIIPKLNKTSHFLSPAFPSIFVFFGYQMQMSLQGSQIWYKKALRKTFWCTIRKSPKQHFLSFVIIVGNVYFLRRTRKMNKNAILVTVFGHFMLSTTWGLGWLTNKQVHQQGSWNSFRNKNRLFEHFKLPAQCTLCSNFRFSPKYFFF